MKQEDPRGGGDRRQAVCDAEGRKGQVASRDSRHPRQWHRWHGPRWRDPAISLSLMGEFSPVPTASRCIQIKVKTPGGWCGEQSPRTHDLWSQSPGSLSATCRPPHPTIPGGALQLPGSGPHGPPDGQQAASTPPRGAVRAHTGPATAGTRGSLTWNTLFCSLIFLYFSSSGCRQMLSRYLGRNREQPLNALPGLV